MTIYEVLKYITEKLKKNNINDYNIKSKIIVASTIGKQKEYLIAHDKEEITEKQMEKIEESIEKIIQGKPIQYITNHQEFMKLDFFVNEDVLIPQPDTEILIEEAIEICKKMDNHKLKILDLCTGSGVIAISLARNLKEIDITGSDISKEALKVAMINNTKHETKVEFIESDLFNNINEKFDVIISNPPYIKTGVIKTLEKEVQNEPLLALDGGEDGLDIYRRIIKEANDFLNPEGYLCLEIGYDQREEVMKLIEETKKYSDTYSKKDLAGNDRIIVCRRK